MVSFNDEKVRAWREPIEVLTDSVITLTDDGHELAAARRESASAAVVRICLGNMVARTQLRTVFDELLHRAPKLTVGEPDYLVSNFVHGVKSLPCRVR